MTVRSHTACVSRWLVIPTFAVLFAFAVLAATVLLVTGKVR